MINIGESFSILKILQQAITFDALQNLLQKVIRDSKKSYLYEWHNMKVITTLLSIR